MSTTPPPWLESARTLLGTTEGAGKANNPVVLQFYSDCGHPEVKSDDVSWCAGFVGSMLKRNGLPIPPADVNLLARSYCSYGAALSKPEIGCIGVWPRGAAWQGHVGFVDSISDDGKTVTLLGGNQGKKGQVSRATYKVSDALAFRKPVAPTVAALRAAGSKDVQIGDSLQKASVGVTLVSGGVATANAIMAPAEPALDAISEALKDATAHMSVFEKFSMGAANVAKLAVGHPWVFGIALAAAALALLGWRIKQHRVQRAQSGAPLSAHTQGAA
jgi:uncharacterized protein (TIGR02594 family)